MIPDTTLGMGVIGCGSMARVVLRLLLPRSPRLKLVAVSGPDPRSVESARQEFGDGFRVEDDVRAMVRAPDVDGVVVSSWNCHGVAPEGRTPEPQRGSIRQPRVAAMPLPWVSGVRPTYPNGVASDGPGAVGLPDATPLG